MVDEAGSEFGPVQYMAVTTLLNMEVALEGPECRCSMTMGLSCFGITGQS